ncbi:Centrosomal protein of [Trichinella pseudospiralis]
MIISHTALLSRLKRPRLNGHRSSSGLHRSRPSTKPLESDVAITAASIQVQQSTKLRLHETHFVSLAAICPVI